jgi:hypothetical protein
MPIHVSGNIVSTVHAIAEKASDMIKEDWGPLSLESWWRNCIFSVAVPLLIIYELVPQEFF